VPSPSKGMFGCYSHRMPRRLWQIVAHLTYTLGIFFRELEFSTFFSTGICKNGECYGSGTPGNSSVQ
jgi:hypothetical protein